MITDLKILKAVHSLWLSKDKTDSVYSCYGRLYPGELVAPEDYAELYRRKLRLIREQKLVQLVSYAPAVTVEGSQYIAKCDYDKHVFDFDREG